MSCHWICTNSLIALPVILSSPVTKNKGALSATGNSHSGISSGLVAPAVLTVTQQSRRYEPASKGPESAPMPKSELLARNRVALCAP